MFLTNLRLVMSKFKKTLLYSLAALLLLGITALLVISPLAKYLIEKYDVEYTGREIKISRVYVNPFTGYVYLRDVKMYENASDTVFFSSHAISCNFALAKLFSRTYELTELTLDQPRGYIIQDKDSFNFKDLILKFSPKEVHLLKKPILHINILNIKVVKGEFYYRENVTPIYYFIKNVNLKSSGMRWDVDSVPVSFSFESGMGGGSMDGEFSLNSKTKDYRLKFNAHRFNLNIVGQYLKDMSQYGSFRANLDANLHSKGNLIDRENVTTSGFIQVNDFHFGKNLKEDYVSFQQLAIAIKELSPKRLIYSYDSVSLNKPYFKYEKYDYLDNVQTVFGKKGANIEAVANSTQFNLVVEIARYLKIISKNFFKSRYSVDRVAVYEATIKYNDYSLNEKFAIALSPFTFTADSIKKIYKRVNFELRSGIQPYGKIHLDVSMNPNDSSDFDLKYSITKIPVSVFNPYLIKYTSFPLDRGTIEVKGLWHVRNGDIQSQNSLAIIDPRLGDKLKNKNNQWLPLRFALFFVRERANVIDYEIPITGNLKDPKFHLKDVILDALSNVFVKPATSSYRAEVKNMEMTIEKSIAFSWQMRSSEMNKDQKDFLYQLCDYLKTNTDAVISISPELYAAKEKEHILMYEARKMFLLHQLKKNKNAFTSEDSLLVLDLSIKDSLFVRYLNKMVNTELLFTVQEKCAALIPETDINKTYANLNAARKKAVYAIFKEQQVDKQISFKPINSMVPYNGFSYYKIDFKGEPPEYVLKAYEKMNELNERKPRSKFKKERKRTTNHAFN